MPFPKLCFKKDNEIYSYEGIPECQSTTMFMNADVVGDKTRKYLHFRKDSYNYILPTTNQDPDSAKLKFQYKGSKFGVYNTWGQITREERKKNSISSDLDNNKKYITHFQNNSSYQQKEVSVKSYPSYSTTNTRWTKTYTAAGDGEEPVYLSSYWTGPRTQNDINDYNLTSAPVVMTMTSYEHISKYTTYYLKD